MRRRNNIFGTACLLALYGTLLWGCGYDGREVMEKLKRQTGAEAYEYVYGNVLSETYLLKGVK